VTRPAELAPDPAIAIVSPDDLITPERFRAWLDQRQAGKPVAPVVTAAETLAAIRAAGEE
jgi:hypothetical protein